MEFVGETTLSGAFKGFERPENCPVDSLAGNFVAVSARTGRQAPEKCPEGAERFVPLPHKSLFTVNILSLIIQPNEV